MRFRVCKTEGDERWNDVKVFNSLELNMRKVSEQFITLMMFAISLLVTSVVALRGDHVCQETERYYDNVTEYVPRNITIRQYKWCMQVPPRCSTFVQKEINESKIITVERTRIKDTCCDGYKPDVAGDRCEISCEARCLNGRCNDENKCYCAPGYRGDYCEKECDPTRWGRYCRYHCECQTGSCDPVLGLCSCPPGRTGLKCETPCQTGYFGAQCRGVCSCSSSNQTCDPEYGRCTNKMQMGGLKKYHTISDEGTSSKRIGVYLLTTSQPAFNIRTTATNPPDMTTSLETLITSTISTQTPDALKIRRVDRTITSSDKPATEFLDVIGDSINGMDEDAYRQQEPMKMYNFATISLICIVFFAVTGFLITGHYLKRREKVVNESKPKSIFHTPLPDPPAGSAPSHKSLAGNAIAVHPPLLHFMDAQISRESLLLENREIDLTTPSHYDQLPTSLKVKDASHREINLMYASFNKQAQCPSESVAVICENVYDEIPCWHRSDVDNNALYINTRAEEKTHF